jgi:hypothetical protein
MIANITVTDQYTTLLSAGLGVRVANVGMYFCNAQNQATVVSVYALEGGSTASDSNVMAYNVVLPEGETFLFGEEKFILESGEKLVAKGGAGSSINATLTFMSIGDTAYATGGSAVAVVSGGEVVGVVIVDGGSGYISAPSITFSAGSATATATINSAGELNAINITSGGSGYTSAPTVEIA